jgi:hypothetical protein
MKIKLYMVEENGRYVTTFRKRQLKQFIVDNALIVDKTIKPFQWANYIFHRLESGQSIVLNARSLRIIKLCDRVLVDTEKLEDTVFTRGGGI